MSCVELWLLIRPPTRIKNWQMPAVFSSDDCIIELVACMAHTSKICFGKFLWSLQGETHKGKSLKLLPLPWKNQRLLHRLNWAGCPVFLSLVDSFEWMVMNPHWACLKTGWGQINPGGVVCLSSVICSEGQGQMSNFTCDGPKAIV